MIHDYKKLKLKCGLEIHQQLDTHKLFCNCKSTLTSEKIERVVERELNPVVGETGKIDIAAEFEKNKNNKFMYLVPETVCLVELDEEPPRPINQEALKIAIQISFLLNCKIFPITQVMRKTVINGSNTSGFQRTALIAHDGFIETSKGRVGIDYVFLEEDSARIASKKGEKKTYNLDRLGIPLVEIATGPHMHSPEQIKEAALKIGEILRACKVKRGLGTIRQDVNISIEGSKRVEIKGFQDPKMMIKTIDEEISRQIQCIKDSKCQNEVRKAKEDGSTKFLRPMPTSSRMYPETDLPLLIIPKELINEAKSSLPKLASENRSYLQEFGLNDELIKLILKEEKLEEFKTLIKTIDNPELVAKTITLFKKEIEKKSKKTKEELEEILNIHAIESILEEVGKEISENDVKGVLEKLVSGKSLEESLKKEKVEIKKEIEKLVKEKPGLTSGAYMGLIMSTFKGLVSGKEVSDALREFI